MKAKLYRNIDLVRIPIKAGISEYYFPQNVDWAAEKIDRIAVCLPTNPCVDPFDGTTPVLTSASAPDLYFNIYSADQREILHAVNAEQLWHRNNHGLAIDSALDLSLCSMYFSTAPAADATLLLYIYHGTREDDVDMAERSVTVEFPLQAGEQISLQQVIAEYIHALPSKVKGVIFWSGIIAPAYFTLRNFRQTYVLQNLHSELARPSMNGGWAGGTQMDPMLFDNIDIDFYYSTIRNADTQANTQKITFLY